MECRIFFVNYSCNVRSSVNECRRPKFDVDVNQPLQQEFFIMRTPSCVAALNFGVLIKGQALPTQAQRSSLTHLFRDVSSSCPATINTIDYVFARIGPALLHVLPSSNAPVPFLSGDTKLFYDGAIFTQLSFVIQDPNSTWRRTDHFNKRIFSKHHRVSQHPNQTEDVCQRVSSSGRLEP